MLHFLPLETSFRHRHTMILKVERTLKRAKTAERNCATCENTFHQPAAKNQKVNVVKQSIASVVRYSLGQEKISIHYLTGQNRGLSGLKNIWPVIMTGDPLSVIFSPFISYFVTSSCKVFR